MWTPENRGLGSRSGFGPSAVRFAPSFSTKACHASISTYYPSCSSSKLCITIQKTTGCSTCGLWKHKQLFMDFSQTRLYVYNLKLLLDGVEAQAARHRIAALCIPPLTPLYHSALSSNTSVSRKLLLAFASLRTWSSTIIRDTHRNK